MVDDGLYRRVLLQMNEKDSMESPRGWGDN